MAGVIKHLDVLQQIEHKYMDVPFDDEVVLHFMRFVHWINFPKENHTGESRTPYVEDGMLKQINPASTQLNLHGYIGTPLLDRLFNAWKGSKKQFNIGRVPTVLEKMALKEQLIEHVNKIEVIHATYCPLYFIPYTLFCITCSLLPIPCYLLVVCRVRSSGLTVCVCCIHRQWRR